VPIVLLSPDTLEGARLTMQALLAGARDYLIKRVRDGQPRLAVGRGRFLCGVRRLLGTHWAASVAPCLGEAWATPETHWCGLAARDAKTLRPSDEADPWGSAPPRCTMVLATSRSLGRLARSMVGAPERLAGPALLFVPQSRRFAQALREALSRRWNRPVLELRDGEPNRPGTWRLAPGRTLLRPGGGGAQARFALLPNRWIDDGRSTRRQVQLLASAPAESLTILLLERPAAAVEPALLTLLDRGQRIFVHREAVTGPEPAGAGTWLEGQGEWVGETSCALSKGRSG
jgi:hypothetical protein